MQFNRVSIEALIVRAIKTFIQAFAAALSLGILTPINDVTAIKAMIVGAVAAGISAVMNLFIAPQEAK